MNLYKCLVNYKNVYIYVEFLNKICNVLKFVYGFFYVGYVLKSLGFKYRKCYWEDEVKIIDLKIL